MSHIRLQLCSTHCLDHMRTSIIAHWIWQFAKHGLPGFPRLNGCVVWENGNRGSYSTCHTAKFPRTKESFVCPRYLRVGFALYCEWQEYQSNVLWGRFHWDFRVFDKELLCCFWTGVDAVMPSSPAKGNVIFCPTSCNAQIRQDTSSGCKEAQRKTGKGTMLSLQSYESTFLWLGTANQRQLFGLLAKIISEHVVLNHN